VKLAVRKRFGEALADAGFAARRTESAPRPAGRIGVGRTTDLPPLAMMTSSPLRARSIIFESGVFGSWMSIRTVIAIHG
jgi:hypothetical protein